MIFWFWNSFTFLKHNEFHANISDILLMNFKIIIYKKQKQKKTTMEKALGFEAKKYPPDYQKYYRIKY